MNSWINTLIIFIIYRFSRDWLVIIGQTRVFTCYLQLLQSGRSCHGNVSQDEVTPWCNTEKRLNPEVTSVNQKMCFFQLFLGDHEVLLSSSYLHSHCFIPTDSSSLCQKGKLEALELYIQTLVQVKLPLRYVTLFLLRLFYNIHFWVAMLKMLLSVHWKHHYEMRWALLTLVVCLLSLPPFLLFCTDSISLTANRSDWPFSSRWWTHAANSTCSIS